MLLFFLPTKIQQGERISKKKTVFLLSLDEVLEVTHAPALELAVWKVFL